MKKYIKPDLLIQQKKYKKQANLNYVRLSIKKINEVSFPKLFLRY